MRGRGNAIIVNFSNSNCEVVLDLLLTVALNCNEKY
jgi:hypothetical protein